MALMRVRRLAQLTLPAEVRRALNVQEGDYLEAKIVKDGVLLKPVAMVERKRAWKRIQKIASRVRGRKRDPKEDVKAEEEKIAEEVKAYRRERKHAFGMPMRFLFALMLSLVVLPAHADDTELRQRIIGSWKLVSVVYEDQDTKERTSVLGEHPRGRQIATADGLWLALVTAEGRPIPKTDEERAQALRTMIAYTGRYRVEDGKVITKVEAAWNEAWVGGEQTRFIRFEGDRLFIESPPMPHPNRNNKVVRVIVIWEREK